MTTSIRSFCAAAANLFVASLALASQQSSAASFDCAKAGSRVEQAICKDPKLSQLDSGIAKAYAATRDGLEEVWRERLLKSQRVWLGQRVASKALGTGMRSRLQILQHPHVLVGGVDFLKFTDEARPMFVAMRAPGADKYNQWVDQVWIDAKGETTQLQDSDDTCGANQVDCTSESSARSYDTTVASPVLISVKQTKLENEQGSAHPMYEVANFNWWMSRNSQVQVADIFQGNGWKAVIAREVRASVRSLNDLVTVEDGQIDDLTRIEDWTLTRTALVVDMDGYNFNLGRGMREVEIPWKAFGTSLRPEFAQAIGAK